jgi:HK97 family phage portal protein
MGRLLGMSDSAPARDPSDDQWYGLNSFVMAGSGVAVTPEKALLVPVVIDCLQALADPLASLPLKVYRKEGDETKTLLHDHPVSAVFADPNGFQTGHDFRSLMQWNLGLYRNAYAEIVSGPRGYLDTLKPIHPSLVTPFFGQDGSVWYEVSDAKTGTVRNLSSDEIWHLKAAPFTADGLMGIPVTETGREVIGAAIAVQDYGARFFSNDARPGGIIEHPGSFKDGESRKTFLEKWRRAFTRSNAHRWALLEFGMKAVPLQHTNEQSQFLETRRELGKDLCRLWKVPPHKVGILDNATFSNIEHQGLEFVTDTLLPWLTRWEKSITSRLIAEDGVFAEFDVRGLLRGDTLARYQAYAIGRQWGWLSVNDIRKLENQDPVDNGDQYLQPLNMVPAGTPPSDQKPPAATGRLELVKEG